MNPLIACMIVGMAGLVLAEPPSGYAYQRPSFNSIGGGSGGYSQVSSGGYQSNEGANVDPQLLEQLKSIIIKEEVTSGGGSGGSGNGYPAPSSSYGAPGGGYPSSSYGVPSTSYGVPGYSSGRVVGIDFEGIRQGIEVAQLHQVSQGSSGGSYPSSNYGAPSRPSSVYGPSF